MKTETYNLLQSLLLFFLLLFGMFFVTGYSFYVLLQARGIPAKIVITTNQSKKKHVKKVVKQVVKQVVSVNKKKERFKKVLVPAVCKVHNELMQRYTRVLEAIQNHTNLEEIASLKKYYKVYSDEELLAHLKPHPVSITLAQAALESSWGTSRFFKEANNVFGMWSANPKESRIAAAEKRGGTRTIWLRKFDTIDDSIRAYYDMIAKGDAYNRFRELRLICDDPYKITSGLDTYSEMGLDYTNILNKLIKYNKFTQYDHPIIYYNK